MTRWVEGWKEKGIIEWFGKVRARVKKVWKYGWEEKGWRCCVM